MSYSDLLSKFGEISFQEYVSEGISHPVFYGDLVYKLRRVKCEGNFVSSCSKIVKVESKTQRSSNERKVLCMVLLQCTAFY